CLSFAQGDVEATPTAFKVARRRYSSRGYPGPCILFKDLIYLQKQKRHQPSPRKRKSSYIMHSFPPKCVVQSLPPGPHVLRVFERNKRLEKIQGKDKKIW